MNLESKWLEDFSALAATRSFSQAAERRFVTQPAFSRRIRSLEAALGLTLVNRSRTPVELTAAGQLFLVTARTVVEQLGEVLRHLHHLEGGQGEVIQVAAAHSLALGFFPRWIAQLRNDGMNIATRLVATNVGDAVHALREGGLRPDAGLLRSGLGHADGPGDLPVAALGPDRNAAGVRGRCRWQAAVRP
nr:hypothetical protein GCM10020185_31330 [Pseudomonas brassicacearum subsp. brassicacearum]